MSHRARWGLLAIVALVALVPLAGSVTGQHGAKVVAGTPVRSGWKTIDYRGVRVDVPEHWERFEPSRCAGAEHWGPPEASACNSDLGVAFYLSLTFDPAHGAGVRHADPQDAGGATWGGWISAGADYVIYVADPTREVVSEVLGSFRKD